MTAITAELPVYELLTKKAKRGFAAACLALAVVAAMLLLSPHDPSECRFGEPPHVEIPDITILPPVITRPTSPYTFDLNSGCPGGFNFSVGNFKLP
jgi:hypothetical protein